MPGSHPCLPAPGYPPALPAYACPPARPPSAYLSAAPYGAQGATSIHARVLKDIRWYGCTPASTLAPSITYRDPRPPIPAAGVFAQAPLYAELQLLAHQVMAIRSSQCGEAEGEGEQGSSTLGPGRAGAGAGARGGYAEEEDSEEEEVSGALPTAAGGLGVGGGRGGGGREEHEVVKALDRTLIKTLEVAREWLWAHREGGTGACCGMRGGMQRERKEQKSEGIRVARCVL